jgi:hypothetical protein
VLPGGVSLHDAVITAVEHAGDDIILHVDGAQVPRANDAPRAAESRDFDLASGAVTIIGVRAVTVDGTGDNTVAMAADSGEILRFDWLGDGQAEAFIIWTQDGARKSTCLHYKIDCAALTWDEIARTAL